MAGAKFAPPWPRSQAAGIEVILDVVLNHTGEGDELVRPCRCAAWTTRPIIGRDPETQWRTRDDTGCGNTLALDRPAPLRLTMDTLRAWAGLAGVHGFRFDLATTMGRRDNGFDPAAPLAVGDRTGSAAYAI